MSAAGPAKERLQDAIERLRTDIDRVEFWADALDRLSQPIPQYEASDHLSRHLLPSNRRRSEDRTGKH
jgi:hypothetical protein